MNTKFKTRVDNFLSQKNIAFAGYSGSGASVANGLYDKFRKQGYNVFAINPKFNEVTDFECYPDLKTVPEKIDAVMIATSAEGTLNVVNQCIEQGIKHVWVHKSFGNGSYNEEAVKLAEENGIEIIPNACPMMFLKPDPFHFCVRVVMNLKGKLKI